MSSDIEANHAPYIALTFASPGSVFHNSVPSKRTLRAPDFWRSGKAASAILPLSAISTASNDTSDAGLAGATVPSGRICARAAGAAAQRSDEHTSELQYLMRLSYAVFCLKK